VAVDDALREAGGAGRVHDGIHVVEPHLFHGTGGRRGEQIGKVDRANRGSSQFGTRIRQND
jgi:hypothetical protein